MSDIINVRELRAHLAEVVGRVRKGGRVTVLYRSRPAFDIVPVGKALVGFGVLEQDSLYLAPSVGTSKDGQAAKKHDEAAYA